MQLLQAPTAKPTPGAPVIAGPGANGPSAVYEGYVHQREELRNQLSRLGDQRDDLARQLQDLATGPSDPTNRAGLQSQLAQIDKRVADVTVQLANADANVAAAAAIPGAVVEPPPPPARSGPPDEFWVLSGIFIFVVLMPLSIGFARRLWKRSAAAVTSIPQDIYDRFTRVEQSLDTIAIEVERLGEGQRYVAKVLTERQAALGAGAAEHVDIAERERLRDRR